MADLNNPFSSSDESTEDQMGWIVTFADSMSLLLAFFVLLISFSTVDKDYMDDMVNSVNDHLGGGVKPGDRIMKADFAKAHDKVVIQDDIRDRLIEKALENEEKNTQVIENPIKSFSKMDMLKEMLKDNPALLKLLLEKKIKEEQVKERKKADVDDKAEKRFDSSQAELILQNLEQYVFSEGINDFISIRKETNGDIAFDFDCVALFEKDSDVLKESANLLLFRVAHIFSLLPNHIAIRAYSTKDFSIHGAIQEQWALKFARCESLLKYFVDSEYDIEEKRFSILVRGYNDVVWNDVQKVNLSGEGVIGITLFAFEK